MENKTINNNVMSMTVQIEVLNFVDGSVQYQVRDPHGMIVHAVDDFAKLGEFFGQLRSVQSSVASQSAPGTN